MIVLCVDPSPWGIMELKHDVRLIAPGAVVHGCRTTEKAVALARAEGCDVLLTEIDFGGPKWEGLELAERIKGINPSSKALKQFDSTGAPPSDLAVFSIDVNGLKTVNDTLGHDAGDELICGAADCITAAYYRNAGIDRRRTVQTV